MLPLYGAPLEGSKSDEAPVQIFLRPETPGSRVRDCEHSQGYAFRRGNVLFDVTVDGSRSTDDGGEKSFIPVTPP